MTSSSESQAEMTAAARVLTDDGRNFIRRYGESREALDDALHRLYNAVFTAPA